MVRQDGRVLTRADTGIQAIDLSNVGKEYSLIGFNALSQGKTIFVPSEYESAPREIPPVVNICIALSIRASEIGRGIFLWQPKERRIRKMGEDGPWHSVPDVLLCDMVWSKEQTTKFKEATYSEKREYLNAEGRLGADDVVLPFFLHFPGKTQSNPRDARVSACINGVDPPLCMISIPGYAYIGWVDDILPTEDWDVAIRYRQGTSFAISEYVLTDQNKRDMIVADVAEMYATAIRMMDLPRSDAFMFYQGILDNVQTAEDASKKKSSNENGARDGDVGDEENADGEDNEGEWHEIDGDGDLFMLG